MSGFEMPKSRLEAWQKPGSNAAVHYNPSVNMAGVVSFSGFCMLNVRIIHRTPVRPCSFFE
jgi:hypothetical protein